MSATHGGTTTATWNSQPLGEVTSIGGVKLTADTHETTPYNVADKFKKFIRGFIDGGEVEIVCNFDASDTGQTAFATDFYAGTERTLLLTFPTSTGTTWSIPAIPVGLGTEQPRDDKIGITLTIKVNGKPTFSTASSNNLSDLTITTATLYPAFAAGTYDYTATSTGASVTVTPTASAGVITVNGSTVATGVASSEISLGASGTMTTVTVVVVEANKAPKTYTVRIAKTA